MTNKEKGHNNATLARSRDFVLYVVIGIAAVGATIWWTFHEAKVGSSPTWPMKWLAFAALTGIAFGYAIRGQRPNWRKPKFWAAVGVLAVAHLTLGIFVIWRLSALPLILMGPLGGGECLAIGICLQYLVSRQAG